MQHRNIKLTLLAISILLGLVLALQFKSILASNKLKLSAVNKLKQLEIILKSDKEMEESIKASISKNEKKRDDYLKSLALTHNDEEMKKMIEELKAAKLKAGFTDVKGPGVTIIMDDAPVRLDENPLDIIIHDVDIVRVLNVLKIAGAQAISVNDERIISLSEQICAGTTIRINRVKFAVPYEIKAIGDPDILEKSLYESEIIAKMLDYRIRIKINKSNDVFISKFDETNYVDKLISKVEVVD